MTLSNVKPVYPNSIFPWLDRVDNQDIDFANDINSVVAEVESTETILGTRPQVEAAPPTGGAVSYSTVSSRISDAMTNAQMPFASLTMSSLTVPNTSTGVRLPFKAAIDRYGSYNGNDITIPASGWWLVSSTIQWPWVTTGYTHHYMTLNGSGNILSEKVVDWEFSGNKQPVLFTPGNIVHGVPSIFIGNPIVIPRWWRYGKRPISTSLNWEGALHKGDRISVFAENGTSMASVSITNGHLKVSMIRVIPGTFTSG